MTFGKVTLGAWVVAVALVVSGCAGDAHTVDGERLGCRQFSASVLEQHNNMVYDPATDSLEIDTATNDYLLVGADPWCAANPDASSVLERERAAAPR